MLVLVLLLWAVTVPLSDTARPGSLVYSVTVGVSEPAWAWVHLTQAGRSEQWVLQLERRYQDLLQAYATGEEWQIHGALRAEAITFLRVRAELARAGSPLEAKPAFALAAKANGLVRGYGQVFAGWASEKGVAQTAGVVADASFFAEREQLLQEELKRLDAILSGGTDKQDLIRGVDEQLRAMDGTIADAFSVYSVIAPSIPSQFAEGFQDAIVQLQTESAQARLQISQDYYADGYKTSARVQGKAFALLSMWYGLSTYSIAVPPILW